MASYPIINGLATDFSSVEIDAGGTIFTGVSAINYTQSLEPGIIKGTSAQKLARTRGDHDASGNITMWLADYYEFIATLGDGYMEKSFDTTVSYSMPGGPLKTDRLIGARIKSTDSSHTQGSEGLSVSLDLDIMMIECDGLMPIANALV